MRKRIITPGAGDAARLEQEWLDVDHWCGSRSPRKMPPIRSNRRPCPAWKQAGPVKRTIRPIFDQPQRLRRIHLVFEEREWERTQEFVLRWSPDGGKSWQDIVRQQCNLSPTGTVKEVEDYRVELSGVSPLELTIDPNKSGGEARASLE